MQVIKKYESSGLKKRNACVLLKFIAIKNFKDLRDPGNTNKVRNMNF